MVTRVEAFLIISLFRTYELVSQIEELFQALATKDILVLTTAVSKNCVASSDILNQQWEIGIDIIFNWTLDVES